MSAGRRDLFAVLHWTEPQLRSAPQWYIFAVLHLRSGTSSQCSSGQSHIPVVHLRSAPQWCIFAVVHLRSAPVDRATFQWYIFAVLRHKLSTRSAEVRCVSQQIWSEVSEVCERLMDPQSFRVWLLAVPFFSPFFWCRVAHCHIWVFGGHDILCNLCAWVLAGRLVRITNLWLHEIRRRDSNNIEPNAVTRRLRNSTMHQHQERAF